MENSDGDNFNDTNVASWIQTDEAEDVAASVRHAVRCLAYASEDQQSWKWFCLALHSALQGACVCHLVTTASPVGAVTKKNTGEWFAYFEVSRSNSNIKPPGIYLMNLPDLLQSVREPNSAGDGSNTAGVSMTDQELDWLKRFHKEIRNQFMHFAPQGWSIEISGLLDLAKLIARVIGEILEVGWAFRHQSDDWKMSLHRDLSSLAQTE